MAVYTDITDEELNALLSDFDLGAPLSFKGIAEGVENSNFLLETETGKFILTVYYDFFNFIQEYVFIKFF